MEAILRQGLAALGLPQDAVPQLIAFSDRLLETNKVMNLTAITEPEEVARLHFLDSAALLTLADFRGKTVVDVGTGAGFPGMPLRLIEPSLRLTLLDSLGKRITFLQGCCDASPMSAASTPGRRNLPWPSGKTMTSPSPGPLPTCACSRSSACLS